MENTFESIPPLLLQDQDAGSNAFQFSLLLSYYELLEQPVHKASIWVHDFSDIQGPGPITGGGGPWWLQNSKVLDK